MCIVCVERSDSTACVRYVKLETVKIINSTYSFPGGELNLPHFLALEIPPLSTHHKRSWWPSNGF
jgi:hypothetical protein